MATLTYPCHQCGAKLQFTPGQSALACPYCGSANEIAAPSDNQVAAAVEELDYAAYLSRGAGEEPPIPRQDVKCSGCGAQSTLDENVVSDRCMFCAAPLVSSAARVPRTIVPSAIVPFQVKEPQAREAFKQWIGHLWFAPNVLRKAYRADRGLKGLYTPYWTYAARSTTPYVGERADKYFVNEQFVENGESKTRQVEKIRWKPVAGSVDVSFEDVVVVGSHSLPEEQVKHIAPWKLDELQPYRDEFVSGFRVEAYQVGLAAGFNRAREQMEESIRSAIQSDIGGDDQRIQSMSPQYSGITFKHLLLPVWLSAYRYGDKTYRFMVNGQTGKVQGERPWSVWKIGLAVVLAAVAVYVVYRLVR